MRFYRYVFLVAWVVLRALLPPAAIAQPLPANKAKDSLTETLAQAKDDTAKAKTLFALGQLFAATDSAKAASYANEGRQLAEGQNWKKGTGLYYLLLARICRNASDNTGCLENARKAYTILEKTSEWKNTAAALAFMANSYEATGFFAKSIECNLAALRIYERFGNTHGIGMAYNNIGVNYYDLLQYDKAIENYQKALGFHKQEGDPFQVGSALDNIAMVYFDKGSYDSADLYDRVGIQMFEVAQNQAGLGRIYLNRGHILIKMHNADSAEAYYRKSLAINKSIHNDDQMSQDYGLLSQIYLTLSKDGIAGYRIAPFMNRGKEALLDSAEFYAKKSLASAGRGGDLNSLMNQNLLYSDIEERLGHYQNALASHKDYVRYKDSIFNDENKQKIAALESERLVQTKDQEIALQAAEARRQGLLKRVVSIAAAALVAFAGFFVVVYNRRKKARFEREVMEVEMKALRAQMNPHFISNALHAINNYVMQNDRKNASDYLAKFASLMRLILENSREPEVSLEQDLHALELYMQLELLRVRNAFAYHIEVNPEIDAENTLVPPMLLQPFAENAILHGLRDKENGVVHIRVRKSNDMICCIIEDNGNGSIDTPSAAHADGKVHKSFGRKIIDERLNVINRLKKTKATVHIFQVKDAADKPGGVRVELLLPMELAF